MIAPPFLPCPPRGYGGIERVIASLSDRLVLMGHDVTLFGHRESRTRARLVHFDLPESEDFAWHLDDLHVARALATRHELDVVHNHSQAAMGFLSLIDTPSVTTVHGTTYFHVMRPIFEAFRDQSYVALSESQKRVGVQGMNWVATVPNGIDTCRYAPAEVEREYLLHAATLCERKGTREAIQVARETGIPLVLMGRVDPLDRPYFEADVEPYVDGRHIRYVGEVYGAEKLRLFQGARGLVLPLYWEEPFGLVFLEALACGVPVLTLDRGSARELVRHGETGFIGREWTDLIEPARRLDELSPLACRRSAEPFTVEAMAEAYARVYERVIG
jgi:glycosyltransferase involved in cell wall biosynthesis